MASSPVLELERLLLLECRRPAPADTCGWWRSEPDTELRHTELDTDSWLPSSEAAPQPGPRMEEVRCGTGAGGPCAEATELEESVEGEHNTSSGTLNFRINLKEQRMTQAPLNKSMEESIIKTPLISSKIQKLTKTKKPKMTTSTPKPRKVTKKTARSTGA